MYQGISLREARILEEIYDRVRPPAGVTVRDTPINLLNQDGSTEAYRVYSISSEEGLFFLYGQEGF